MKPRDSTDRAASSGPAGMQFASPGHVVQSYDSDDYLTDAVAAFIADGLVAGEPVVAFVTEARTGPLRDRLTASGFDVERALERRQLRVHSAERVLRAVMQGEELDAARFHRVVGGLLKRSAASQAERTVRAFGEMVAVLSAQGRRAAARRLEELWNELKQAESFTLLCTYARGHFDGQGRQGELRKLREIHDRVVPAEPDALSENGAGRRAREIGRLERRARALEAEVARRRAAESALREAKEEAERANRVKSDFLAVMSHELRTPLNAIIGYSDLLSLQVGGPLTAEQEDYVGRIDTSAQQLLKLVDQVLSLSRIEAGKAELRVERVDLAALAHDTVALVRPAAEGKGLTLDVRAEEVAGPFATDPGKLRQILLNLLANAVKFTDRGGVRLEIWSDGAFVVFDVHDTGVGIDAAALHRIFEPFAQADGGDARRHGGTGLGLSVSRDLAHLLGGDLGVVSTPGAGSVFTLRLPQAHDAADAESVDVSARASGLPALDL